MVNKALIPWSTGLSCKQQGPSSHLSHIFIITEAPSHHLKVTSVFQVLTARTVCYKIPSQSAGLRGLRALSRHPCGQSSLTHSCVLTGSPVRQGSPGCSQDPLGAHRIPSPREASAAVMPSWRSTHCCTQCFKEHPTAWPAWDVFTLQSLCATRQALEMGEASSRKEKRTKTS